MKHLIKIKGNIRNEFSSYCKISDIEKYLEVIKGLGYTHVDIIYDEEYQEVRFTNYIERFETDEEYERRKSNEAVLDGITEHNELRELKRLKEKYEK